MRNHPVASSFVLLFVLSCAACAPPGDDPGGGEVEQDITGPDGGTIHYGPINPPPRNLAVTSNYGGEEIDLAVDCAGNADHQIVLRQVDGGTWTRLKDTCLYGVTRGLIADRAIAPPTAPTVTLSVARTTITVSIVDNADNELGYRIYRKPSSQSAWGTPVKTFGAVAGTGGHLTFSDYYLDYDKSYDYRVEVYHQWDAASVVKTALTIPNAPLNLRFTDVQPTQVTVRWDDTSATEDGYKIVYQAPGYATGHRTVGRDVTAVTIYVGSGVTYHVTVAAYNATGLSDAAEGDVTTPSQAPPPPTVELQPHDVNLVPAFPHANESMVYNWEECNFGSAAAASYKTVVKRNGAVVLSETYSLAANSCVWRQTPSLSGLPAGDLQLEVIMDADQQVAESNEADNVNLSDYSVTP